MRYLCAVRIAYAILFIVVILAQPLIKGGWMAYYYLNKSYIAANFCENKAKVELKCDGKCYLKKKLLEAEVDLQTDKPGSSDTAPSPDALRGFFFSPVFLESDQAWSLVLPLALDPARHCFGDGASLIAQDWISCLIKPPVFS